MYDQNPSRSTKRNKRYIIQNVLSEGKKAKIGQKTLINNIDNGSLKLCYFHF